MARKQTSKSDRSSQLGYAVSCCVLCFGGAGGRCLLPVWGAREKRGNELMNLLGAAGRDSYRELGCDIRAAIRYW